MSTLPPPSLLDHFPPSLPPPPPADQLCYLHCTRCDTDLAVSVPCTSLFKTVTVRCGHCSNLLPVTMRALNMLPSPAVNQFHGGHSFFSPSTHALQNNDQISNGSSNFLMNNGNDVSTTVTSRGGFSSDLPNKPPAVINRPPEKRQRVPSAYNRFIKEEIQRIKARNPDISHREAFSAAAKNWAHFPHIHFGRMADQIQTPAVHKSSMRQQETEGGFMKESFFASANVGVSPY